MTIELRRCKRVPLILEVRLESLSGNHTARTGDISLGGCYIESLCTVVMPGEDISFEVQLPSERWIRLRGEVAYHLSYMGFGVRFTDVSEFERNMLVQLIDSAS
jgi:hypothetical protein